MSQTYRMGNAFKLPVCIADDTDASFHDIICDEGKFFIGDKDWNVCGSESHMKAAVVAINRHDDLMDENTDLRKDNSKKTETIKELRDGLIIFQAEVYRIRKGINENLLNMMLELQNAPSDEARDQFLNETINMLKTEQEEAKNQLN